jgi:hypothetical protein
MAVPYIDLQTIGEAIDAHGANGPTGPFGGLGPMPEAHKIAENTEYDLSKANVGMTDEDILTMLALLKDDRRRVLVAKAGTGTGKSTFMPYRLLDPPEGAPFNLAALGPIIVTEPRVQATVGVAWYVGTILSGAGGIGPGYPVGFQVSGNKAHDDSCQLIYVTDGTMINWLREGRLSTIGTVIVDEAHERSTNIDFIMGYLKKAVDRYPHLRVIITSATFDEEFYQDYFGGPDRASIHIVEAVKPIGYGFPLFPDLDAAAPSGHDLSEQWRQAVGPDLPLRDVADPDDNVFVTTHFQPLAPPLGKDDVAETWPDPETGVGWSEDLHDTTKKLVPLRFQPGKYSVPEGSVEAWRGGWAKQAPEVLGKFIVDLVKGLNDANIYGDVLAFLPTTRTIEDAVEIIKAGLGIRGDHGEDDAVAKVYPLISSLPTDIKEKALVAQVKGNQRKIVVSTNLAETSLTVEGVRFVVDSGLIAQDEWNPQTAQGGVQTSLHSQAGIRQRWGRVGRKAPGWAFPLYTKVQFLSLAPNTAPGSTRSNLENLVMTAKMGGIDDVVNFDWPAKFWPGRWPQSDNLDPSDEGLVGTAYESAARSRRVFLDELERADVTLRSSGATDEFGDPTPFGKELSRAPGLGSEASKIALLYADRLACVPEVATILKLLDNTNMVRHNGLLLSAPEWPAEWQLEAAERHRALASGCRDDAELVLQVMAVWERSDPSDPPAWEPSEARQEWSRRSWVNNGLLLAAAEARHEVLVALSPAMKEDVKRYVEPALVKRARGAITRAFASLEYRRGVDGVYQSVTQNGPSAVSGVVDKSTLFPDASDRIIPLKRNKQDSKDDAYLSNIITIEEWALPPDGTDDRQTASGGSLDLLLLASRYSRPEAHRSMLAQLHALWPSGMRVRLNIVNRDAELVAEGDPADRVPAAKMPEIAAVDAIEVENEFAAQDEPIDVAEADANPELDTSWPSPVVAPLDEFELETEIQLDSLAEGGAYLAACRECGPCLAGRLEECENPLPPRSTDLVTNDIESWLDLAWRNPGVVRPSVVVPDAEVATDGWYEVVGCHIDDGGATVLVRAAWRQDEEEDRPGLHDGLIDGDAVCLEVGPERTGHRGVKYRTFHRNLGGRLVGRFALRSGNAGEALEEGSKIEGLVVERKMGDISTLTFIPNNRRLGLRLDLPRLSLTEAKEKYPEDSVVQMVVTGVHDSGGSAWLETADGTEGRVVKARVGRGALSLANVLTPGERVNGTVVRVGEHRGEPQIEVSMPEFVVPSISEQLAALGVVPNEVFDGVVDHATDFGVFVALGPVNGLVHKSNLPGFSPTAYSKGSPLRVAVLHAGEDPKKPGQPKIGLAPA